MSDITDHYPVFVAINIVKNNDVISTIFRDHSKSNIDKLILDVNLMSDKYFAEIVDVTVEEKCSWFVEKFQEIYNRACPKKTKSVSIKKVLKPWISGEIRRMANYKHRLFKQYKMSLIPFHAYNIYKNNLTRRIKQAKQNYYVKKFNDCNSNIKKNWKIINSFFSNIKRKANNTELLDEAGNSINNPIDVANKFCDFFSTVADKLDEKIPPTDTDPLYYMPDRIPATFSPLPATPPELIKLIKAFKDKPCHVINIPVFIFKLLSSHIAPIICDIFNCAITEGVFPAVLKLARILPLHKGKSHKITDNFRPISLLPLMAKIIEKLMKTRAVKFIEDNKVLYNKQFGFRSGCSTSDAILHYVDDCVTALDNKLYTVSIFLDFSKAFDTVNKDIMLRKLDRLGFRDNINSFFKSYLTDRQTYVNIGGHDSTVRTTNIGLP